MHDVNPLGPMMHLEDLERYARQPHSPRLTRVQLYSLTAIIPTIVAGFRDLVLSRFLGIRANHS